MEQVSAEGTGSESVVLQVLWFMLQSQQLLCHDMCTIAMVLGNKLLCHVVFCFVFVLLLLLLSDIQCGNIVPNFCHVNIVPI